MNYHEFALCNYQYMTKQIIFLFEVTKLNFKKKYVFEQFEHDSGDYKRAARVLETIFQSHPSNRLTPIVNTLSKTLLFIPRRFYSVYKHLSSVYEYLYSLFAQDNYGPYSKDPVDTTYIDVTFNVWAYSGSDKLWASFIYKLYTAVENEYSKEEIDVYQKACKMINGPSPNSKSDEFRNAIARLSATKRWLLLSLMISIAVRKVI